MYSNSNTHTFCLSVCLSLQGHPVSSSSPSGRSLQTKARNSAQAHTSKGPWGQPPTYCTSPSLWTACSAAHRGWTGCHPCLLFSTSGPVSSSSGKHILERPICGPSILQLTPMPRRKHWEVAPEWVKNTQDTEEAAHLLYNKASCSSG